MQKENSAKGNLRGSADIWLDGAYQILVESGIESVKIMTLANQLNLSRTSFYWHFLDRDALLDALILRWQKHNTGNLIARTELYADTITEAMLNLCDCWVDPQLFDSRLDFAMRNWAHHSSRLKAIFEATDKERISAIQRMFSRFGFSQTRADIRAHTVYYTQVGYISMLVEETLQTRIERVPAYVETFSGQAPSGAELARFNSRYRAAVNV